MSHAADPGRLLWRGFDGTVLPAWLGESLAAGKCGGIVLFKRNVENPQQVWKLARAAAGEWSGPGALPIAVDQEGGRVARLREPFFTAFPSARAMAAKGDPALLERAGMAMGKEMSSCGINLDFAPVVDVQESVEGVVGDRSFGGDPATISRMAAAWARGLSRAGVEPCAKHFPGHGEAFCDSHEDLPTTAGDAFTLEQRHLRPFRELIASGVVRAVMVGHLLVPWIDPARPASLSPELVEGLLRRSLGFDGVVISDDMEMGAVTRRWSPGESAVMAVEAGCDAILVCSKRDVQDEAYCALCREASLSPAFALRIAAAVARLDALCARLAAPLPVFDPSRLRTSEHLSLARLLLDTDKAPTGGAH